MRNIVRSVRAVVAQRVGVLRGCVLLVVCITAAVGLLLELGDPSAIGRALGAFPTVLLIPVLLLAMWNYALRWLKWQFYLRVLGVSGIGRLDSTLIFLSGFAMALTPGKAGELTKGYWLREIAGAESAPMMR